MWAVNDSITLTGEHVAQYRRDGYAILRGVFSPAEVAEMAGAFNRFYAEGRKHPKSYRHGNLFYRIASDPAHGRVLRLVQWPSYVDPTLDRVRLDSRMLEIVAPLIGATLKQIINQMHWKPPGAAAEFGWHQDIRFRRPRAAYRQAAASYVQTGIAVDPHRAANGAMRIIPGSHRLGELSLGGDGRVMDRSMSDDDLVRAGLDPAGVVDLEMEPGDVALWHLHLVHGSGPNRSTIDRRFYLNGYVIADNCDRGVLAFKDGERQPLGDPVLIHYEDLHARPDPHYVDA
jgi:ectoine hydroxylase-related dioxygenase (phytanoyl-CoA dioxygenase family)